MTEIDTDDNIEVDAPATNPASIKASKRKGADSGPSTKKIRLIIEEPDNGPLSLLTTQLKERGLKVPDFGIIVQEALGKMDEEWWKQKLEDLTPLEWKVQAALENPDMRDKLMSLLEGDS